MDEIDLTEEERIAEEVLASFSNTIGEEIEMVNNLTKDEVNILIKCIFENLKDLSDLDASEFDTNQKISMLQDVKYRLTNQLDITRNDILEENFLNIFIAYFASMYFIWTPDVIEYIKRFIIVGLIGILTYDINARYFTSDYRKNKSRKAIKAIDDYVKVTRFDVTYFDKFREIYIEALKLELDKFYDDFDDNTEHFESMKKKILYLLHQLNLDYLVEEKEAKRRIR